MKHHPASFLSVLFAIALTLVNTDLQAQSSAVEGLSIQSPIHEKALSEISLEGFRLQDAERELAFDDGTTFTLVSASSLVATGAKLELESYAKKTDINAAVTLVFKLFPNGKIGITSKIDPDSKQARIGAGFPNQVRQIIQQVDFDKMSESKQAIIRSRPHQYRIE